ncbi:MAG: SDR family NAD(P)-dependent oxidoreductase [Bacteroidota bacterium]
MKKNRELILKLIPAIRMIRSSNALKSGLFLPAEQITETDPEKISLHLGQSVSVFSGGADEILEEVKRSGDDAGDYLFIKEVGLLGLSENQAEVKATMERIRREPEAAPQSGPAPAPTLRSHIYNKVIAITGGAMGYGEGIARSLYSEGANVVLLDINETAGQTVAAELNGQNTPNRAFFVKTDVTDLESVSAAVYETVLAFGGLDVMISNAGVLKAGGIEEMEPDAFNFVTKVNYNGYFNCVKAAAPVMKQQNRFNPESFTDIIQINSKSGLEGSKKNFAYAGSKFAGIGLTHSFAMELMPDRIKVNAICPGNFFEGPLWSDPEKGLFVQYLNAGKVAGARTVEDVKRHYESLVPAGRGCRITDVVKAIKYVIDQEYETGQAIPVTGGQVMLS